MSLGLPRRLLLLGVPGRHKPGHASTHSHCRWLPCLLLRMARCATVRRNGCLRVCRLHEHRLRGDKRRIHRMLLLRSAVRDM